MDDGKHIIGGHEISVTRSDKIMYPESGMTKGQMVDYYNQISKYMLPHLAGRPVTRTRFPGGIGAQTFMEKQLPTYAPQWITRLSQQHSKREVQYPIVDNPGTLVWLANQAALELHTPQWRCDLDNLADRIVFDLDPGPGCSLDDCAGLALIIREHLSAMGIESFPITSGSKGIHIYGKLPKPLQPAQTRVLAKTLAEGLTEKYPELVVNNMLKDLREDKILIDWSQNHPGKTTIAPYSLRGKTLPFVAAPRSWDEIKAKNLTQLTWDQVIERCADQGDLLSELVTAIQPNHQSENKETKTTEKTQEIVSKTAQSSNEFIPPMLAQTGLINRLNPDEWIVETKWDGHRLGVYWDGKILSFYSRNGIQIQIPAMEKLKTDLKPDTSFYLDTELVAIPEENQNISERELVGKEEFKTKGSTEKVTLAIIVFDILKLDQKNLTDLIWADRRKIVETLMPFLPQYSPKIPGFIQSKIYTQDFSELVQTARKQGWEGLVAKRKDSKYIVGTRDGNWRKHKLWKEGIFIVYGWKLNDNHKIKSFIMGLKNGKTNYYVGCVSSGLTSKFLDDFYLQHLNDEAENTEIIGVSKDVSAHSFFLTENKQRAARIRYSDSSADGQLIHATWLGWA